jgi:DNA replicative helicase MCM subunit Mcm2 (Cdc46/Mcm family)
LLLFFAVCPPAAVILLFLQFERAAKEVLQEDHQLTSEGEEQSFEDVQVLLFSSQPFGPQGMRSITSARVSQLVQISGIVTSASKQKVRRTYADSTHAIEWVSARGMAVPKIRKQGRKSGTGVHAYACVLKAQLAGACGHVRMQVQRPFHSNLQDSMFARQQTHLPSWSLCLTLPCSPLTAFDTPHPSCRSWPHHKVRYLTVQCKECRET